MPAIYQLMIPTKILEFIGPIFNVGLKTLDADKDKAAASLAGLPACFEYGFIGTKAYAKPNIQAIALYLKHLQNIWGV